MDTVSNREVLLQGGGQPPAVSTVPLDQEQQTASVTAVAEPIFRQKQQKTGPTTELLNIAKMQVTQSLMANQNKIDQLNEKGLKGPSDSEGGLVLCQLHARDRSLRIMPKIFLAKALESVGDITGIRDCFTSAILDAKRSGFEDELYSIVDALIELDDLKGAQEALKQMSDGNKHLKRHFVIINSLLQKDQKSMALELAEQLKTTYADANYLYFYDGKMAIGEVLINGIMNKKIEESEAISLLQSFQQWKPEAFQASTDNFCIFLAESQAKEGRYEDAIQSAAMTSNFYSHRRAIHSIIKQAAARDIGYAEKLAGHDSKLLRDLVVPHTKDGSRKFDDILHDQSAKAKLVIVAALIEKGDIEKAIEVSKDIDPSQKNEKDEAMAAIVKAYADAGDIDRARNFASKNAIDYMQEQAKMDILRARIEVLEEKITEEMLDATAKLECNNLKSDMLLFFIQTDPSKENLDKAEVIANSIDSWEFKEEIKKSVVSARLKHDDIIGAERTVFYMGDTYCRDDALKEIALAYLKTARFDKAIDTYRLITSISKCELLISIAEICIENNKNIDQVISIAKAISFSKERDKVLIAIVKALAKKKKFIEASNLTKSIQDPLTQVEANIEMFKETLKNGQFYNLSDFL